MNLHFLSSSSTTEMELYGGGECRSVWGSIKQAIYVIVIATAKSFLSLFMYAVARQKTRI
jgi:hypothetical protein